MKVYFKYPRAIDNKSYVVGLHEIDDSIQNHWYFKALLENNDVQILDVETEKYVKEKKKEDLSKTALKTEITPQTTKGR